MRAVLALLGFVLVSFAAGAIGGIATARSVDTWYAQLRKPPWNPPAWVFGPVWSCLYLLMGIAAWWVWRRAAPGAATLPLTLFAVQLLLNAAWSLLFFGLRRPDLAFAELILLWAAIAATLLAFWQVSPVAGALLLPYLAWVSFAGVLNAAVWQLNPRAA